MLLDMSAIISTGILEVRCFIDFGFRSIVFSVDQCGQLVLKILLYDTCLIFLFIMDGQDDRFSLESVLESCTFYLSEPFSVYVLVVRHVIVWFCFCIRVITVFFYSMVLFLSMDSRSNCVKKWYLGMCRQSFRGCLR